MHFRFVSWFILDFETYFYPKKKKIATIIYFGILIGLFLDPSLIPIFYLLMISNHISNL